jgi:hypothetical protein
VIPVTLFQMSVSSELALAVDQAADARRVAVTQRFGQ